MGGALSYNANTLLFDAKLADLVQDFRVLAGTITHTPPLWHPLPSLLDPELTNDNHDIYDKEQGDSLNYKSLNDSIFARPRLVTFWDEK